MSDNINENQDKGLQGNEKIEQAIAALQQEATQEMLGSYTDRDSQKNERKRSVHPCSRTTDRG